MAETWTWGTGGGTGGTGTITLNVIEYSRPGAEIFLQEKELVPDPTATGTTTPQTVLMGVGRKRKRRELQCWATAGDFNAIESVMYNLTSATLTVGDGSTGTYYIEKLSPATRMKGNDYVWFSMYVIEA